MKNENDTTSPLQRISETFGWQGFPHALFYQTDFSLRFELGADLSMTPIRFLQAMDRARQVTGLLFAQSQSLTVLASYYGGERRTSSAAASFKALRDMGFKAEFGPAEKVRQNDAEHMEEFGEDLCRYWHAADFGNDAAQVAVLLWASIASEMAVTPKARHLQCLHIADFTRGIAALVYDDRGMDIIGTARQQLQPLYDRFGDWLLDHDRPGMDGIFGRKPAA